jgi:S-adenosylmethionine decarboxylase
MEHYRGTHVIIDLFGCNFDLINDGPYMENVLCEASVEAGCTILHKYTHKFEPQGVTSIVVLAESHISAHCSPEYNKIWIDVFTCGSRAMPEKAVALLIDKLKPETFTTETIERG